MVVVDVVVDMVVEVEVDVDVVSVVEVLVSEVVKVAVVEVSVTEVVAVVEVLVSEVVVVEDVVVDTVEFAVELVVEFALETLAFGGGTRGGQVLVSHQRAAKNARPMALHEGALSFSNAAYTVLHNATVRLLMFRFGTEASY